MSAYAVPLVLVGAMLQAAAGPLTAAVWIALLGGAGALQAHTLYGRYRHGH